MNCKEIITTIIIPLICSLVSGGLTLLGVLLTIKSENKKRKEEIILRNKPLFYIINPKLGFNRQNVTEFKFLNNNTETNNFITIIIKNTNNAILILNYISINNIKYYSNSGNIVDINTPFYIYLYVNNNTKIDKNSKIIFSIKDTLGNEYKYKLLNFDKDIKYITDFEEIKSK